MNLHRLCVSCGGTGGHFYPGLAVAREWKQQGGEVLLLLGGKHADSQIKTAEGFGIPAQKIPAAPLAHSPGGLLKFIHTDFQGWRSCRQICREFQPDALLAMGQRVIEGDYGRVTIVEVEGKVTLDRKLLRKYVPEATLALCEKTGKPSIRFDVHGKVADAAPSAA